MFNSFYHIHIPKCGGRKYLDTIVNPLRDQNPQIKILNEHPKFRSDPKVLHKEWTVPHQGWDPNIQYDTYVTCILRDPIERVVSNYVHIVGTKTCIIDEDENERNIMHFDKSKFIQFIETAKFYHNMSSKMILFYARWYNDFLEFHKNKEVNKPEKIKLLKERINRINLLIDIKDFKDMDKSIIGDKIKEDTGFNLKVCSCDNCLGSKYKLKSSKLLYESLSDLDKEYLKQFFKIDYEIYDDKSLFWKPN